MIAAVARGRVVHGRRMACCCLVSVRLFGGLQIFLTLQKGGAKRSFMCDAFSCFLFAFTPDALYRYYQKSHSMDTGDMYLLHT